MLIFASNSVPLAGPDADAGAMVWILWVFIDFPLGFVALFFAETASTNAGAVSWMAAIGGLQWAFWGWLLWVLGSRIGRNQSGVARDA